MDEPSSSALIYDVVAALKLLNVWSILIFGLQLYQHPCRRQCTLSSHRNQRVLAVLITGSWHTRA